MCTTIFTVILMCEQPDRLPDSEQVIWVSKPTRLPKSGLLYGCDDECCAEVVSYPPEMLWWFPQIGGWFCENHLDDLEIQHNLPTPLVRGVRLDILLRESS